MRYRNVNDDSLDIPIGYTFTPEMESSACLIFRDASGTRRSRMRVNYERVGALEPDWAPTPPVPFYNTPAPYAVDSIAARLESDPSGISLNTPGAKADAGKLRPTLIFRDMARALEKVIEIATAGAVKYTSGGWLEVPNGEERYDDADLRHMLKRFKGQPIDADSMSLHLAHEAWNALAKLELHLREEERNGKPV